MTNNIWTPMLDEIRSQQEYLLSCYREGLEQADRLLKSSEEISIDKIYITGCGDSFYAGTVCKMFFSKYAGVSTEVYQALEFSRYIWPEIEENSLVVGISSSGEVARTIECLKRAKKAGARTVAITADPNSRLARAADSVIEVKIPSSYGKLPGTRSYMGSVASLMGLAAVIGIIKEFITRDDAVRIENIMENISGAIAETIEINLTEIESIIENENIEQIQLAGSGPNLGTAEFGAMKILEAAGLNSSVQGTEEWAHTLYFTAGRGTCVFFIAPEGNSFDRTIEIIPAVKTVDGTAIVITEERKAETFSSADYILRIRGVANLPEEFSGLLFIIPLEILAYKLAVSLNATPMGFEDNPAKKKENFRQIRESRITV